MSGLTEEFSAVIGELATELGEGLTATLVVATTTLDRNTGGITESASTSYSFRCPPPSPWSRRPMVDESLVDALRLITPRILDAAGALVTPARGDRIMLYGRAHQIVLVEPIGVGDDVAGFSLAIRG